MTTIKSRCGDAGWMFEDQPEGTLARDGQVLATSLTRLYVLLGVGRLRDAVARWRRD